MAASHHLVYNFWGIWQPDGNLAEKNLFDLKELINCVYSFMEFTFVAGQVVSWKRLVTIVTRNGNSFQMGGLDVLSASGFISFLQVVSSCVVEDGSVSFSSSSSFLISLNVWSPLIRPFNLISSAIGRKESKHSSKIFASPEQRKSRMAPKSFAWNQ